MADDANVLDKARSLIEDRLKELDDERKRLEKALGNLISEHREARPAAAAHVRRPLPAPVAASAAVAAGPAPTTP